MDLADVVGDSSSWPRRRPRRRDAEWIVLCGVRFMAESADILTAPAQAVFMPDATAGCSMANMADPAAVARCWDELAALPGRTLPVTYINSAAAIKAFVGRRGGSVCTSSNAAHVLRWAFGQADRVLFLPDQHLGRNTAHALGVPRTRWRSGPPAGAVRRAWPERASCCGPATAASTRCSSAPT